jgi:hypothetical protein
LTSRTFGGSSARDAGEDEVAAGRHVPGHIDHLGEAAEEAAGLRLGAALKVASPGQGLDRGHAHALAVDRVEVGDRVAQHQQAVGEAVQPLVAVPDAGREAEGDRVVQRFGVADRLADVGEPEDLGEGQEAVWVGGRVVTQDAGQGQHPPVAFEPLERPVRGRWGVAACRTARSPSRASAGSR